MFVSGRGAIAFEHVTFAYNDGEPVLGTYRSAWSLENGWRLWAPPVPAKRPL